MSFRALVLGNRHRGGPRAWKRLEWIGDFSNHAVVLRLPENSGRTTRLEELRHLFSSCIGHNYRMEVLELCCKEKNSQGLTFFRPRRLMSWGLAENISIQGCQLLAAIQFVGVVGCINRFHRSRSLRSFLRVVGKSDWVTGNLPF